MTIGHLFKGLASDTLLALFIRTALAIEGNAFIYPVIFPVLINFFKQLLLIDFGRTINSLLDFLFQIDSFVAFIFPAFRPFVSGHRYSLQGLEYACKNDRMPENTLHKYCAERRRPAGLLHRGLAKRSCCAHLCKVFSVR